MLTIKTVIRSKYHFSDNSFPVSEKCIRGYRVIKVKRIDFVFWVDLSNRLPA